jgi:hypothetical protein
MGGNLDLALLREGAAATEFPGQQDAKVLHGMHQSVNVSWK